MNTLIIPFRVQPRGDYYYREDEYGATRKCCDEDRDIKVPYMVGGSIPLEYPVICEVTKVVSKFSSLINEPGFVWVVSYE